MEHETDVAALVDGMPATIRHENLADTWSRLAEQLGLDADRGMEIIVAAPRDLTLRHEERVDAAWGGAWEWNLGDGVTRTTVVGVLLAAALAAAGAGTGMAPVLIPTVLPLLFDLKRVRLERTADHYLRIIGARKEVGERRGTLHDLYSSLPADVRSEVTKRELLEFLGEAVDAGQAHDRNGVFEVLPNGETSFRIHIR